MRRWRSYSVKSRGNLWTRMERGVIRLMVLVTVLLVLAQMGLGLAKDPVDFYISVAQKVEAPSMDMVSASGTVTPELIPENSTGRTWKLTLKASPAAPVRVLQNGRLLGTLTRGELEISVQAGTIQLDGTSCSQIVRIQVIKKDSQLLDPRQNQSYILEHNVQLMRVAP